MINSKRVPLRMCLGCRQMKNKKELIKLVKNKDGDVSVDISGKKPGRGSYICKDIECYNKAHKTKQLQRAFSMNIDDDLYKQLRQELEKDIE